MARVFPFRGLRYNPSKVKLAEVVTQPYDKISPEMQDRYYAASPHNLVRVILGRPQAGDGKSENVYTRAAACVQQWRAQGILTLETEPSIYSYTQTFQIPGDPSGALVERRGFIGLGQVEDYEQKVVFRHEQTLSKPKADRLNLLRATETHFGQIFMLYSDPGLEIDGALNQSGPPTTEVCDEYGVLHRLWQVSGSAVIEQVQAKMADKKLIIADGHHRYETALSYRDEIRKARGGTYGGHERVMMTFVNMDTPGLVVLPTHRVVFGLEDFSIFGMVAKLQLNFEVEDLGPLSETEGTLERLCRAGTEGTAFVAVTSHGGFLLRSRPRIQWDGGVGLSEQQRALDVVRLHKLVLESVLGLSEEDIRDQKHLKYVRDPGEAINLVPQNANVAFLMNPVRIDQVRDVAFSGEVLPQKSTDFYPKLLSGLVAYALQEAPQPAEVGGRA